MHLLQMVVGAELRRGVTVAMVQADRAERHLVVQQMVQVVRVDLGLAEIRRPAVRVLMAVQVVLLAVSKAALLLVLLVQPPAVVVVDLSLTKTLTTRQSHGLRAAAVVAEAIQPVRLSHLLAQAPA